MMMSDNNWCNLLFFPQVGSKLLAARNIHSHSHKRQSCHHCRGSIRRQPQHSMPASLANTHMLKFCYILSQKLAIVWHKKSSQRRSLLNIAARQTISCQYLSNRVSTANTSTASVQFVVSSFSTTKELWGVFAKDLSRSSGKALLCIAPTKHWSQQKTLQDPSVLCRYGG